MQLKINKTQKLSDLINTALTDVQCIKARSQWLLNENTEKEKQTIKPLASVSMYSCGLIVLVLALAWCQAPQWGGKGKKRG